ncbi:MAG TPA: class I SAM-dependent rRNA methyltransferase [Thermoanaerobaculia bacterium]|nr:class I SAM-dependent rRNA methyltransferase [Thermoanaerobaculia bacterium]
MIRLRLRPGREASVARRHPWLFSGALASLEGDGSDGHAEIVDSRGTPLARGSYSPESQIVARLWTFDGRPPDAPLFRERFEAARRLRQEVVGPKTTGFRAINSEGDLCPGVLMDIYGDTAVLELLTEGTEKWEPDLMAAARDVFSPREIVVRRTGSIRDRGIPLLSPGEGREGANSSRPIPFTENGLTFFADIAGGQKTGFFLDQRDNRMRLRSLAAGRTVLNLFSYSGAFSVAALAGGAARAVDVDASEAALDLAREHRRSNGFPAGDGDFVRADVFEDLRRRVEVGESWDIVVCDPPAFARRRGDLDRAARGYKDANRLAMNLVRSGGWLLTCSCSGHVGADLFQKIVFAAGVDAGVSFSIAARQGAGADHPVSLECPEGEYLKGLWLSRRT